MQPRFLAPPIHFFIMSDTLCLTGSLLTKRGVVGVETPYAGFPILTVEGHDAPRRYAAINAPCVHGYSVGM